MKGHRSAAWLGLFGIMVALGSAGCSDRSRMSLQIQSIKGASAGNDNRTYLEVDLMGDADAPCLTIQDAVTVSVELIANGTVGPTFSGYLTGYKLEYFYYDPNDGVLRGPVGGLTLKDGNLSQRVAANASVDVTLPLVSFRVKGWTQRVTCGDNPGFPGPGSVSRMIARVTVYGKDADNKEISDQGNILVYLYDYGPAPSAPDPLTGVYPVGSECGVFGGSTNRYWSAVGCN